MIDLSICIPVYNNASVIADCLQALPEACRGLDWEVIVVDNASTDESARLIADRFPHVRLLVNERNRGFAAAINQAASTAEGRHLLLLNADTVAAPESLTKLARFLDQHPRTAAIGPRLRRANGRVQTSIHPIPSLANQLLRIIGINTTNFARLYMRGAAPRRVAALLGACVMIPSVAWKEIGPLDERFFFYLEDTDWCLRARQQGWQIYYWPQPEVLHLVGTSALSLGRKRKSLYYDSLLAFFDKHYGERATATLKFALRLRGYRSSNPAAPEMLARNEAGDTSRNTLPEQTVSAIVLAKDEEEDLPACLESLRWVDELIVVVSAESKDATEEVARSFTERVLIHPWQGYARTRNWALEQASHPWVLMVDADELVTPELAVEIRKAIARPSPVAYEIPRSLYFCGHRLRHGGCWPDYVLRLFRREAGRFGERHLHERFEPIGPVGKLREPLLHYSYRNLDDYFSKFPNYASLAARDLFERGRRVSLRDWATPSFTFLNRYLLKGGFLDGSPGLVYAALGAVFIWARNAKLWELQQTGERQRDRE